MYAICRNWSSNWYEMGSLIAFLYQNVGSTFKVKQIKSILRKAFKPRETRTPVEIGRSVEIKFFDEDHLFVRRSSSDDFTADLLITVRLGSKGVACTFSRLTMTKAALEPICESLFLANEEQIICKPYDPGTRAGPCVIIPSPCKRSR